jgi:hypothetical protein
VAIANKTFTGRHQGFVRQHGGSFPDGSTLVILMASANGGKLNKQVAAAATRGFFCPAALRLPSPFARLEKQAEAVGLLPLSSADSSS